MKKYSLTVRGRTRTWSFQVLIDPKYLEEYQADKLQLHEVVNEIPDWVVNMGWTRLWCAVQDWLK